MRDLRPRPLDATRYSAEELHAWQCSTDLFFQQEHDEEKKREVEAASKGQKFYRVATSDLLYATAWQFFVMTGLPLRTIEVGRTRPEPQLHRRLRVTFNQDMGPDNLCLAAWCMNHRRLRCSFIFSWTHVLQRAMWGGVQRAGKYATVLIGCILISNERGPWKGEANYQEALESCHELTKKLKPGSPMLVCLGPRIAAERGEDPFGCNYEWQAKYIEEMEDANWCRRKPPKTTVTQWNTWNDSMEWVLPEWTAKTLPLTNIGISKGWSKRETLSKFVDKLHKLSQIDTLNTHQTAKQAREKCQSLRNAQSSSMQLTTFAMLDIRFRVDIQMITFVTSRWRELHGYLQANAVNADNAKLLIADMVYRRDEFWRALKECGLLFQRLAALRAMCFIIDLEDRPAVAVFSLDAVEIQEQRELARHLWRLIFSEMYSHIKGFGHAMDGFPCMWTRLLQEAEENLPATFGDLKRYRDAWEEASNSTQPVLQKICGRSMMQWPEQEEMFEYNGGAYHVHHRANADRILTFTADTISLEWGFRIKSDQCKDASSLRQSAPAMWRGPVKERLLTRVFKFPSEVSIEGS